MRIVSQNTAKRLKSFGIPLIKRLVDHNPDVIALQEITEAQADGWSELLERAGFSYVARGSSHGRTGGAMLASRYPIEDWLPPIREESGLRFACGSINGILLGSVYFPTGSGAGRWLAFYETLMRHPSARNAILIGDFQMVVAENEISGKSFERWRRDVAYLRMQDMLLHWRDAFRFQNGFEVTTFSHRHTSGALWLNDHAFVPPSISIVGCSIDWSPIEFGMSDHATLVLDVEA